MAGRVTYELENVFINGNRIIGVESFSSEIGVNSELISVMGKGFVGVSPSGPIDKTTSFNMYSCSGEEQVLSLAGQEVESKYSYRLRGETQSKTFVATNSILKEYEISCSVAEIAKSKFSRYSFWFTV